jgi:hypothetical protein
MSRGSDPIKVALWQDRFSRRAQSELSTDDFCAAEGVTKASYYSWRRKLGLTKPCQPKQLSDKAFQQLIVSSSSPALLARLPGGVEIEVSVREESVLRTIVGELVLAGGMIESGQPSC